MNVKPSNWLLFNSANVVTSFRKKNKDVSTHPLEGVETSSSSETDIFGYSELIVNLTWQPLQKN